MTQIKEPKKVLKDFEIQCIRLPANIFVWKKSDFKKLAIAILLRKVLTKPTGRNLTTGHSSRRRG